MLHLACSRRAGLAALALLLALPAAAAGIVAALTGREAPDFALRAVGASNVRLSEHRGEVVVIAFWGSRCATCPAQLAALDRIATTYRSAGLRVLAVSVDDDQARALEFARARKAGFPMLLDPGKTVSRSYRIEILPTAVIIDRSGTVRHVFRDFGSGHEALYARELRALLNE